MVSLARRGKVTQSRISLFSICIHLNEQIKMSGFCHMRGKTSSTLGHFKGCLDALILSAEVTSVAEA